MRFLRETVTAIDPEARRVTTDAGIHEADVLVVALGADYDFDATPGSPRAERVLLGRRRAAARANCCPTFARARDRRRLRRAVQVPARAERAALLLHDYLSTRGVREQCEITFVIPLGTPVPPSPDTSRALVAAFAERGITFVPGRRVELA